MQDLLGERVAESGFAGFEALNWYAFVAPGRTPLG